MEAPKMIKFEKISADEYVNYFKATCPEGYDINEESVRAEYERIRMPERETVGSACYTVFTPVDIRLSRYDSSFVTLPTAMKFVCNKNDIACLVYPHTYFGMNAGMHFADSVHIVNADDYKGDNEGHIVLRIRSYEDMTIPAGTPVALAILTPIVITDDDDCRDFRSPTVKPELVKSNTEMAQDISELTEAPANVSESEQLTIDDIEFSDNTGIKDEVNG